MNHEFVWYSPEWDEWRVSTKQAGFLFEDSFGEFHMCWKFNGEFTDSKFYLMGAF